MSSGQGKKSVACFACSASTIRCAAKPQSGFIGAIFKAKVVGRDAIGKSRLNLRTAKDGQAVVISVPRVTFTGVAPAAGGKKQDVMLPLQFQETLTG